MNFRGDTKVGHTPQVEAIAPADVRNPHHRSVAVGAAQYCAHPGVNPKSERSSRQCCEPCEVKVLAPPIACSRGGWIVHRHHNSWCHPDGLSSLKAVRERCKGITGSGAPCRVLPCVPSFAATAMRKSKQRRASNNRLSSAIHYHSMFTKALLRRGNQVQ